VTKRILCFIGGLISGALIVWLFGVVPIYRQEVDLRLLDAQLVQIEAKTGDLIKMFETALEIDYWTRD